MQEYTPPKRLRVYFRYNRTLLGDLAGCAWRALRLRVLACFDDDTAVPGAVGFIQTSGELLNFHPHIHLLITDGVFCADATFERFTHFDASLVERLFRANAVGADCPTATSRQPGRIHDARRRRLGARLGSKWTVVARSRRCWKARTRCIRNPGTRRS